MEWRTKPKWSKYLILGLGFRVLWAQKTYIEQTTWVQIIHCFVLQLAHVFQNPPPKIKLSARGMHMACKKGTAGKWLSKSQKMPGTCK